MSQLQEYIGENSIFQQDGAPPHYHREVNAYLFHTAPVWMGRGMSIAWPPRSPDLTPMDFILWGYVKDSAYNSSLPVTLL
jgi:hypothetical protein